MKEKLLIIHNSYRSLGGEDIAVKNETKVLKDIYIVDELIFENIFENSNGVFSYFITNKNKKSMKLLEEKVNKFKPDYVYVHNTWFKASVGIFDILEKYQIPTLIKLHNFRFYCTSSFFKKNHLIDNQDCKACGYKYYRNRFFNKYFENSYIKSFLSIRHGKSFNKVLNNPFFKIAVLTQFQKEFMKELGFNNKIEVLRNIIEPLDDTTKYNPESDYIIYAGRISEEKGVEELINAFLKHSDKKLKLKIIGDGPQKKLLEKKYKKENISFLGALTNQESIFYIQRSLALFMFTHLYEGQPTVANEASINSVPTVFPNNGGIHEFFPENYNLIFEHDNPDTIVNIFKILNDKNELLKISKQNFIFTNQQLAKNIWKKEFKLVLGGA